MGEKKYFEDYLREEYKRLSRTNELLEFKINKVNFIDNEPEQMAHIVLAMCEIYKTLRH